jgi:hypothetical protein
MARYSWLLLILAGCGGQRSTQDIVKMVREAGGTGCYYIQTSSNARPYADMDTRSLVVATVGQGTDYRQCLEAMPEEAKALFHR